MKFLTIILTLGLSFAAQANDEEARENALWTCLEKLEQSVVTQAKANKDPIATVVHSGLGNDLDTKSKNEVVQFNTNGFGGKAFYYNVTIEGRVANLTNKEIENCKIIKVERIGHIE